VQAVGQLAVDVFYPKTKSASCNVAFLGDFVIDEDEYETSQNIGETVFEIHSKHGNTGLQKLSGCFAYAIFDKINNQLVLGRGKESSPMLWVYETTKGVVFSSTFSVFKEIDDELHISNSGMLQYLLFDGVSQGNTFFDGLQALKPNEIRVFELGNKFVLNNFDQYSVSDYIEFNDVNEIKVQAREKLKTLDDSTMFLTGEGSDILLSLFAPDNCRRVLFFTDKFQLFPESMPEKIRQRTEKLAKLFGGIRARTDFEELTITIGDDSSKNPGEVVFEAISRFASIIPYPQASLGAFKNFLLVDKLNLKTRTNIVNTSQFDVILHDKLRNFNASNFYSMVDNCVSFIGKGANWLVSDIVSKFMAVFDMLHPAESNADKLDNSPFEENRFCKFTENLNPYNDINAEFLLAGFARNSQLKHNAQKYCSTEINVLKSFEEELNCRFFSPLDLENEFVHILEPLFAFDNRDFWHQLSRCMQTLDFARTKMREYQGKRWLLEYTQKYWKYLLRSPKIVEFGMIGSWHLQHVLKEYKRANFQGVEALYNLVLLELWLVENEV
ncbi:MAG: hypothetical protein K8S87_02750, partial [Planctomycetes bacterium]|nr:hypothetical protein [Planctomycetota bacterium]